MRLRSLLLAAFALATLHASAQTEYERQGVRLLSRIPLNAFPGQPSSGSGCSGYTSPSGREIAIMGLRNGNAVVDITNAASPIQLAHIPGPVSSWHESVVLGDFSYAVTEGGGGMQIIDLRNVDNGQATLAGTYTGGGLNNVHTIQANPATKHLYLNGSNLGFVVLDASSPTAPVQVGRWTTRYVHDSQIVSYTSGPYAGKEIGFLCCGGNGLYIVDLTNKANIITLGFVKYIESGGYCHSGALTPDKKYFLVNDEFDEGNSITNACTTHIINVENLSQPQYVGTFTNGVNSIDHNSHLRDGYLFLAAYRSGLRVYDASNPLAMKETGFFDTYPSGNGFSYDGNWAVYAGYPSGNVLLADINRGMFVVDPSEAAGQGAPITAVRNGDGQRTGSIVQLRKSDDDYVVLSQPTRNGVSFFIDSETSFSPVVKLDVKLEGRGSGAVFVQLKNWTTGEFVQVSRWPLQETSDSVFSLTDLPAGPYVGPGGKIEAKIVGNFDNRRGSGNFKIDYFSVKAKRE
ncbi:MAG TPA: choice-of-anchor B family protein [Fimbriimonadaceae bacterium]|nr:choice-of-anchor B family protein [Fimbriimonadaceae bacterium]